MTDTIQKIADELYAVAEGSAPSIKHQRDLNRVYLIAERLTALSARASAGEGGEAESALAVVLAVLRDALSYIPREHAAIRHRISTLLTAAAGAPTAQQPLDESANNAGVATGSRNDSPSESVTRGSLPPSDSICDALTAEWQAMGLYESTFGHGLTKEPLTITPAHGDGEGDARAEFERWVAKRWGYSTERWADSGEYLYQNTRDWWQCWQAALTTRPTPEAQGEWVMVERSDLEDFRAWASNVLAAAPQPQDK